MQNINEFQSLFQDYKTKPQLTTIQKSTIDLIKSHEISEYHTLLVLEILRISAPSKLLPNKIIEKTFMNVFNLDSVHLLPSLDLIATYRIVHLLSEKSFVVFVGAGIFNLKLGFEPMQKIIFDYLDEKAKCVKLIFELCEKNINLSLSQILIGNKIFENQVNELEDRRLINIAKYVKNYRYIKNRIQKRKYLMTIFGDQIFKTGKKHDISFEKLGIKSIENKENKKPKTETEKENIQNTSNSGDDGSLAETFFGDEYVFGDEAIVSCEDYQKIYDLYKDDIVGKLIMARKRTCCTECINIMHELANSSDSRVRAKIVQFLPFDSDFILDVSKEVRMVLFQRIIKENINDSNTLLMLFKGCTTKACDEYLRTLFLISIDLDFIYKNRKETGVKIFLHAMKNYIGECKIIFDLGKVQKSMSKYKFLIKYVKNVHLDEKEIKNLMKKNLYIAYLYLKANLTDSDEYYAMLVDGLKDLECKKHYFKILKYVSKYVRANYLFDFENLKTDKDFYFNSCFDHIETNDLLKVIRNFDNNFAVSYFLAKYSKSNFEVFSFIDKYFKYETDSYKILQIIVESNNKEFIISNFNKIFSFNLDKKMKKFFSETISATSILIFFFLSGGVQNYNKQFIIETALILCKAVEEITPVFFNKIKVIYQNYYNLLEKNNKEALYALVCCLKRHSTVFNYEKYQIKNGKIDVNNLPISDKILYTVCDIIKSFYSGEYEIMDSIRCSSLHEIPEKFRPYIESNNFLI